MRSQTKQTLSIYWKHIKKYRRLFFVAVFFDIAWSVGDMFLPLYYKQFFDLLAEGSVNSAARLVEFERIIVSIAVFALLFRTIFHRISDLTSNTLRANVMEDLGHTIFAYIHKHSITFFNNTFVGSLVKQVNYFIRGFEIIYVRILDQIIPLVVQTIMIVVVLGMRDIRFGIIFGVWLLFFMFLSWLVARYRFKYIVERSVAESKATGILADTITNNVNVKLFNGYSNERKLYGKAIGNVHRLRSITWRISVWFDTIQGFLTTSLEITMLVLGFWLWRRGIVTAGDFVLILTYLTRVFQRVWDFGNVIRDFYESLGDADDMTEILLLPHEINDAPNTKALHIQKGEVEFRNVTFNYHETRSVFSHFNLKIASGEKIALVGPSGAGKSTIVKLLLRLHDTTAGEILIDDQPLAKVTQESLWAAVGFVPQDPILFHRTLKENIRYGRPNATDKEVIAAAKRARCHDFIMDCPDEYYTYVGERGVKLSGGERQRVAIARAILRNAPILILDEATSSLDSESERLIQDALADLMKDKTVLVIAHRLSTIMKMDRIIVVENGKIVEQGTHDDLRVKKNGLYQRLWKIQAGGFLA